MAKVSAKKAWIKLLDYDEEEKDNKNIVYRKKEYLGFEIRVYKDYTHVSVYKKKEGIAVRKSEEEAKTFIEDYIIKYFKKVKVKLKKQE